MARAIHKLGDVKFAPNSWNTPMRVRDSWTTADLKRRPSTKPSRGTPAKSSSTEESREAPSSVPDLTSSPT
jgi:hypothetical protein